MNEMHIGNWLDDELGNMFGELVETTETEFEVEGNITAIPHASCDGFIPFTNGGVQFTTPVNLDYLTGTGKGFVNKTVTEDIDKTVERCYIDAREQFIAENRNELEDYFTAAELDANSEKVNYHELYELDKGEYAEALSEMESAWLDAILFIEHRAQFYSADNSRNETGEDEICFLSGVNTDYGYCRDKGLEITFEETVKVGDLTPNRLKEITKNMLASI